jgi:hypothetical protein
LKDAETRDDVTQFVPAHRDLASLADRPLTREWVEAAIDLYLAQPRPVPLASVPDAFRVGTGAFGQFLRESNGDQEEECDGRQPTPVAAPVADEPRPEEHFKDRVCAQEQGTGNG